MKHFPIVFILVLLIGCTSQPVLQTAPIPSPTPQIVESPQPTPTSAPPSPTPEEVIPPTATADKVEPTAETIPEDTPAPSVTAGEVQIEASDGLLISGTFHPGSGEPPWPGILLMHMVSGSREQWDILIPQLTDGGYAVLAIDLRGHGDTGGQIDWEKAKGDTLVVWKYLSERGDIQQGNTALGGASIGANLALSAASNEPGIKTVVLLSPGLNYYDVTTLDALENYGTRPAFLAASLEDQYAAESTQTLADSASGEVELLMYDGAGHGTVMLDREPELGVLIREWLQRFLR